MPRQPDGHHMRCLDPAAPETPGGHPAARHIRALPLDANARGAVRRRRPA
jgi:hypothetical protein